jgi:hypothetical protein
LAFGVGTVVSMVAFASAIGWIGRVGGRVGPESFRAVLLACSSASVVVGGFWLVS